MYLDAGGGETARERERELERVSHMKGILPVLVIQKAHLRLR
jgi:hypothetical protein